MRPLLTRLTSTGCGRSPVPATSGSPGGDPGTVVETAAALGELGLDLAVVTLPPPHTPAVLTPLADALAQLP
jgi:hypothetical protein